MLGKIRGPVAGMIIVSSDRSYHSHILVLSAEKGELFWVVLVIEYYTINKPPRYRRVPDWWLKSHVERAADIFYEDVKDPLWEFY